MSNFPSAVFVALNVFALSSSASAAPQPVSINTPQGRAIHQNMMQMQANQMFFMQNGQTRSELSERGRIEKEIKSIDARLANANLLRANEKQELKAQRSLLERQLQASERMLKKNQSHTKN